MQKGQTLKDKDGNEVMLFPLPYMKITQGENGSYSHRGTLNIDFVGWNKYGRVYRVYMQADAPFRSTLQDLNKVYVKNNQGKMLPLTSVISTKNIVLRFKTLFIHLFIHFAYLLI